MGVTQHDGKSLFDHVPAIRLGSIPLLFLLGGGALTMPGCSEQKPQISRDNVVANGQAVSFDMMDARIHHLDKLRGSLTTYQEEYKKIVVGLQSQGPGWIDANPESVAKFRQALTNLQRHAEVSFRDNAYQIMREDLVKLSGLVSKVDRKTDPARIKAEAGLDPDSIDTWHFDNVQLGSLATKLLDLTELADQVLAKIAVQALCHEGSHVLTQFLDQLCAEGPIGWFKNQVRADALVGELQRVSDQAEQYAPRLGLKNQEGKALIVSISCQEALAQLKTPEKFGTHGEAINFDDPTVAVFIRLKNELIEMQEELHQIVDAIDSSVQLPLAQVAAQNPTAASNQQSRSSVVFIHSHVYHSSAPSSQGGAFFGGSSRGLGFVAPSTSVSRGGFGSVGASMGGRGGSVGG